MRIMDNNMTVVDDLSAERYASLFNFVPSEEREITFWPRCFSALTSAELSQFDIIIHLAAKTNAAASFENREDMERVNVDQTYHFIDKAAKAGVRLFVFPSSTSVYGVAREIVTEDDPTCINPQSPYAESKIKIENALLDSKMPCIIFRFGTIFGTSPGMRFHTAVNKFCYQACVGEPLTVWKQNYHQKRPYLGLADALRAMEYVARKFSLADQPADIVNQVYNVASGNHTVAEVIEFIKKYRDIEINLIDTPLLNQYSYEVSCDKIANLGYVPICHIEDGIRQTVQQLSRIKRSRPDRIV